MIIFSMFWWFWHGFVLIKLCCVLLWTWCCLYLSDYLYWNAYDISVFFSSRSGIYKRGTYAKKNVFFFQCWKCKGIFKFIPSIKSQYIFSKKNYHNHNHNVASSVFITIQIISLGSSVRNLGHSHEFFIKPASGWNIEWWRTV